MRRGLSQVGTRGASTFLLAATIVACQPGAADPGGAPAPGSTGGRASATGGSATPVATGAAPVGTGGAVTGGTPAGGSGGTPAGGSGGSATGGATAAPDLAPETAPDTTADLGFPPPAGASAACGKGLPAPAEGFHTIQVGNLARRFFLRLPGAYDGKRPWPVIVGFHGAGNKDGSWFDSSTGLRRENEENAILIFGESLLRPGATSRSWQDEDQLPANLAYIDATVAWMKDNLCVDPARVFAAGQSSGAYFAQTMGCLRGDVFRAVASSDGGERYFKDCRGNPGAFIRYRPAGLNAADSRRARDFWIKHNACSPGPPQATALPQCKAYPGCKDGILLWECTDGGAHDWPGYMDRGVWTFFSQFK